MVGMVTEECKKSASLVAVGLPVDAIGFPENSGWQKQADGNREEP